MSKKAVGITCRNRIPFVERYCNICRTGDVRFD